MVRISVEIVIELSTEMLARNFHAQSTSSSPSGSLGNKPHKCEICGRRFKSKSGLEDHVRTHYDEYYEDCSSSLYQKAKMELNVNDARCSPSSMSKTEPNGEYTRSSSSMSKMESNAIDGRLHCVSNS